MNKKIKNKFKNIILEEYYSKILQINTNKIFNHNLLNHKNFLTETIKNLTKSEVNIKLFSIFEQDIINALENLNKYLT